MARNGTLEKHHHPIPIADSFVLRTNITKHLAHLSVDRDFRFGRIPINISRRKRRWRMERSHDCLDHYDGDKHHLLGCV